MAMQSWESNPRILNAPITVCGLGFKSTTYELQLAGWQLSMDQDVVFNKITLAMQHPESRLFAISDTHSFDYLRIAHSTFSNEDVLRHMCFNIKAMGSRDKVVFAVSNIFNSKFEAVDATPTYVNHMEYKTAEDLKFFRPINHDKNIIVEFDDIPHVLDLILAAQKPVQQQIKDRERSRQNFEKYKVIENNQIHAQIISLVS